MDRADRPREDAVPAAPAALPGSDATSLVGRAADFAADAHAGQRRKGTDRPYITHPAAAAAALARHGAPDELIAAGWLHDTLEDTRTTRSDLEGRFGARVATLVVAVTRPRFRRWRLDVRDADVVRLKAADLLSNIEDTERDLRTDGAAVWRRFRAGRDRKLAEYRDLVARIGAALPGDPLAAELAAAFARLEALAGG
jgi:guanosine-3',5'-bis(diphosphate) 3'-pyrophosphohydrolase